MRIPIFTSQAVPEQTKPGTERRNIVRMNGSLLAEAELQKAKPLTALLNGAAQFAAVRYQAGQEAQYNQAALAIEEGMTEAEYALSNSTDIYNVLDGENKWNDYMTELRDKTINSVDSKTLRRKLSFSFEQNEITARFRLRAIVDDKILKAEQAAMAARMERLKNELIQGPGATVENYNSKLGILANDQDKGVKGNRYNPEKVAEANQSLRADIASGYITNTYGFDPNTASQLFKMLDLQDEVKAGTITEQEAMLLTGINDPYALHVLYNIDRNVATKIIQDNLALSLKFYDAEQKLEKDQENDINAMHTKAYNFVISVQDADEVSATTMQQLMTPQAYDNLTGSDKAETIPGVRAKTILRDYLNAQMWANPAQQERMNQEIDRATEFKFAPPGEGSQARYSELYGLAERGELTMDELNTDTFRITGEQYRSLDTKISNESDEALNEGSKLLKRSFRYNEQQAADGNDRLAQASKTAFEAADFELQNEHMRRQEAGNPMTRTEIREFALKQIELFGESYRAELREEYLEQIQSIQVSLPGLIINPDDPLTSMDEFFNGLPADRQETIKRNFAAAKAILRGKYSNQGLF
jgi:predicted  nucleic acid-binding Zn-ribbon protein